MRAIVIGLLVPLVRGSCLPDAIPPGQRQNLVNANGETYPVGFMIANWAASYAANILGATLVEEILGYNTTANLDNVAAGAVASYYGVAGCRTFNDLTDRGCMSGVTYYHVGLETWFGYQVDWNIIQNTYTSMAPKDLGSMGYTGPSGIFIPSQVQIHAYSTQGKALEFYRAWNASWNQPSNFFSSLSSIDVSHLDPCSASGGIRADDTVMRRHVHFTGDIDGVVINDETYSARCDDGFWWASAACRNDLSKCVAFISAGGGWGAEDAMQKFTFHNMPIAIGVAASWSSYTQVPLLHNVTFYWWAPDPTFLERSPLFMDFPPHNAREHAAGKMATATSEVPVNAIVSSDLVVLAPFVQTFADKLHLPMEQMNAILLDQKNTGDTWRDVTCRWIMANRAVWQRWIPDESECFPGFGLYDSVLQDFTDVRVNATNKIVCQACPPGMFSQKLEDNKGVTYVCVPCGKGTSQSSGASLSCAPCKAGEYQDELQSTECKRCDFGTYQDLSGQEACTACPDSTSTLGFGSVAETDCGCPETFIDIDGSGAFECVKCSEGMSCPALSQLADLVSGSISNGAERAPQIKGGYYSTIDVPTEVFLCTSATSCPGGPPGSCAGGLADTPCSQCPEGATWTGSECEDCAGWRQALWALAVAGIFAFLVVAYYLTTSKVTAKATVLFATTASFGMLVMAMQNLGLIGMMTVPWPLNLQGLFSICQFLLLDIDSYGFSCIAGQSEPIRYLLSALIFPVGVAWMALCYAVSKLFPKKYHWEGPKVCSTMGAFLQVGFSTMSATALSPMMCYKHPNGLRSILKYPGVICGSSEHDAMLAIAWILLIVFVFGFVVLCAVSVLMVPRWSVKGKNHLVAAVRFLVFRFRLDSWWFGVPLLIRGPLINLPVVMATDFPPIQVVCIAMILTTMMVMQMLAWPWKVPLLNATDCIISFCIVLLVTCSALYLNKIDETMHGFASAVSTAMLSGIALAIGIMIVMTASALFYRSAMGGKKELKFFNLGSTPNSEGLAKKVQEMVKELEKMEVADVSQKLNGLATFDIKKVTTCITLLATEVAPPADNPKSFKFNKRIASASFDPTLKRETQSLRNSKGETELAPKKDIETKDIQQETETNNVVVEQEETQKDEVLKSSWM